MGNTVAHSFRIDDDLWYQGIDAARAKGSDLSAELRSFVARLVAGRPDDDAFIRARMLVLVYDELDWVQQHVDPRGDCVDVCAACVADDLLGALRALVQDAGESSVTSDTP